MSGQVTSEQFQTVRTNLRRTGRERAGGIEGINLPLEVHKLAYSPDELNIDRLIEYYETRICSVMGVSQRVAGLGSDPTYNNLSEALNDFWERRIVPDRNADAATLNRQWLPLWGLAGGEWRFRFDYSNVPALQENRDALHARVRSDFEKGLLDKQQARALLMPTLRNCLSSGKTTLRLLQNGTGMGRIMPLPMGTPGGCARP